MKIKTQIKYYEISRVINNLFKKEKEDHDYRCSEEERQRRGLRDQETLREFANPEWDILIPEWDINTGLATPRARLPWHSREMP